MDFRWYKIVHDLPPENIIVFVYELDEIGESLYTAIYRNKEWFFTEDYSISLRSCDYIKVGSQPIYWGYMIDLPDDY